MWTKKPNIFQPKRENQKENINSWKLKTGKVNEKCFKNRVSLLK